MPIPVTKCDAALGAEIGFDLSGAIDDPAFAELERIFHDNIVAFFRGQTLTDEQHIAFSRRFGELEIHIVEKYLLPGYPEILLVSNVKNEAGAGRDDGDARGDGRGNARSDARRGGRGFDVATHMCLRLAGSRRHRDGAQR